MASLPLAPHTADRRSELQAMYEKLEAEIEKLNQRVEKQACGRPGARLLMTHPGVGPVTASATEVFLCDPARFADSKALASYLGMIPREYSNGERQRLGGLSKQGNPLLRFLWGEAGPTPYVGTGVATFLPPQISSERSGEGERGRGSQTRDPAVDHVAGPDRV
jgi:transposase